MTALARVTAWKGDLARAGALDRDGLARNPRHAGALWTPSGRQ